MRYFCMMILVIMVTFESRADELDRFNQLYEVIVNNYDYVISSKKSAVERDYIRALKGLSESADIITQKLSRYSSYREVKDIKLKKYCSILAGSFNAVRIGTKSSKKRSEQDRVGALYMLYTYSNALRDYGYPDIKIESRSSVEKYTSMLEAVMSNIGMIYDEEASDIIKDHVCASYRRFARHARTIQDRGLKLGFNITQQLNNASSAINSQRVGWKRNSSQDELNSALQQLAAFGAKLSSEPAGTPVVKAAADNKVTAYNEMFGRLKEFRIDIIKGDLSSPGLSYQDETIDSYLATLSKAECRKFKKAAKRYIEKGYPVDRAKTTALKMIHSYTLGKLSKIPTVELQEILNRIAPAAGLEMESDNDEMMFASPNAKITRM